MTKFTPFTADNHPIPAGLFEDWTEQEKADYANEWAAEFDEEYGCDDGIARTMTADEALAFSKMETTAEETAALRAAYEVACEIFRTQAITLPRLRDAWQTAVQRVEAVR